jgi:hypothetical protein
LAGGTQWSSRCGDHRGDALPVRARENRRRPVGACALAALLAGRVDARGLRVGVTITGGNVSAHRFASLIASARPLAWDLAIGGGVGGRMRRASSSVRCP